MKIDTINNFGLPFFGNFLISVYIGDIQIFPQTADTFKGGQTVVKSVKITESLFSPIVAGSILILDINNISSNIILPIPIRIVFNPNIDNSESNTPVTFDGIVTQSYVVTDDAVNSTNMNPEQKYRVLQLDFMNQDIFLANQKIPWQIPKNDNDQNDFVGWIANNV